MLGFVYDSEKVDPELRQQLEEYGEPMLYFHINAAGGVRHRVKHSSSHQERPGAISVRDAISVEEEMFQAQRWRTVAVVYRGDRGWKDIPYSRSGRVISP